MAYTRDVATILDATPGGDSILEAAQKLDASVDDIYGSLNDIDTDVVAAQADATEALTRPQLGEEPTDAYRGDRGKTAYDHSQTAHAPSDAQKNSDIIKSEVEAVLTGDITSHTHTPSNGVLTGNSQDITAGVWAWTVTANFALVDDLSNGQSASFIIDNTDLYTPTYPTIEWVGDAPVWSTTGNTFLVFFKVNSTLYGAHVG